MYGSKDMMIDKFGLDAMYVAADRDDDDQLDDAAITAALNAATGEIDTYLANRYSLPLPEVPEIVENLACDMALYRLNLNASSLTDDLRKTYEDSVALLRRIGDGRAALPLPKEVDETSFTVSLNSPDRQFTRDKLRGL